MEHYACQLDKLINFYNSYRHLNLKLVTHGSDGWKKKLSNTDGK